MIEHEQLMGSAKDEDDGPVYLCLYKNGQRIDWKESSPEEVLYIPETIFEAVARNFVDVIGQDYYGTVGISKEYAVIIQGGFSRASPEILSFEMVQFVNNFIERSMEWSQTHYLAFQGP